MRITPTVRRICLLVLLAVLCTSCSFPSASQATTPTPDMNQAMLVAILTQYAELTATARAIPTATATVTPVPPTETPTSEPTSAPSPTLPSGLNYSEVQVFVSYLSSKESQITLVGKTLFDIKNYKHMKNDFGMKVDDKAYDDECFLYVMKAVPRLICNGPKLTPDRLIKVQVFQKGTEGPVFERKVTTPSK